MPCTRCSRARRARLSRLRRAVGAAAEAGVAEAVALADGDEGEVAGRPVEEVLVGAAAQRVDAGAAFGGPLLGVARHVEDVAGRAPVGVAARAPARGAEDVLVAGEGAIAVELVRVADRGGGRRARRGVRPGAGR